MLRVIPYPPPRMNHPPNANPDQPYRNSPLHPHHRHNQQQSPTMPHHQKLQKQPPEQRLPTASEISRTYKTCTSLFLTRRLPGALALLQTILVPVAAPKVGCSRALKIKVWSLYFAILDAAAKLGSEEGRVAFGSVQEWKKVVSKVRTGSIWEECLKAFSSSGYVGDGNGGIGGIGAIDDGCYGRIDGDLVIGLTMLLLTHSHDCLDTQRKVEAYMSVSSMGVEAHGDPRLLGWRIKLIELYVLHVLPRVEQWEYAKEFTAGSNDLDEEQKERFLEALEELLEEKKRVEEQARWLERQRETDLEERAEDVERDRRSRRVRSPSVAGSVRSTHSRASRRKRSPEAAGSVRGSSRHGGGNGSLRGRGLDTLLQKEQQTRENGSLSSAAKSPSSQQSDNERGAVTRRTSNSVFARTSAMLNRLQVSLFDANGPLAGGKKKSLLLRTMFMVFAIVWAGSKKKVRERLRRWLVEAWVRLCRTVGMGMRVTYI